MYPSKNQVVYTYTNGQVSKVIANGKTIADISHLPFGPINQIAYGNGLTETIAYNTDYSIKDLKLGTLINREYSYYPNGDIKSISSVDNYDYDPLGSLTKADNHSYSYDQVSNRKSASEHGISTGYTVATNSNRLTSSNQGTDETRYEYDSAGNIIKVIPAKTPAMDYIYDSLNRLDTVKLDNKEIANYDYNAFSQRILKTVNGAKTISQSPQYFEHEIMNKILGR